jgi:hypothetical protein
LVRALLDDGQVGEEIKCLQAPIMAFTEQADRPGNDLPMTGRAVLSPAALSLSVLSSTALVRGGFP